MYNSPEIYICKKNAPTGGYYPLRNVEKDQIYIIEKVGDAILDSKLGGPTYMITNNADKTKFTFLFNKTFINEYFNSIKDLREHKLNILLNEI